MVAGRVSGLPSATTQRISPVKRSLLAAQEGGSPSGWALAGSVSAKARPADRAARRGVTFARRENRSA